MVADHLSRIFTEYTNDLVGFFDHFTDEELFVMSRTHLLWFAHIVNYLTTGKIYSHSSKQDKDRFFPQVRRYYWKDPYLFKHCPDQVVCGCVPESEIYNILSFCHSYTCLLYTSPSPRDGLLSRMPSSA